MGGNQNDIRENALMKEEDYEPLLDFRAQLRETIRNSIAMVAGIVVSRPFCGFFFLILNKSSQKPKFLKIETSS